MLWCLFNFMFMLTYLVVTSFSVLGIDVFIKNCKNIQKRFFGDVYLVCADVSPKHIHYTPNTHTEKRK